MISINITKCSGCNLCAQICHEHCLSMEEDGLKINYEFCSTCCHCIAVCPHQALSWNHIKPQPFTSDLLPTAEQLTELFEERRTIRHFKAKKIARKVLEDIIQKAVYAPTHNFQLRVIIVDDEQILAMIDRIIFNSVLTLYNLLYIFFLK